MWAVSNSVTPRSIALWITLREVSRSVRWPKLLQPRPTAETRRPEPPRLRICMDHPVRWNARRDYIVARPARSRKGASRPEASHRRATVARHRNFPVRRRKWPADLRFERKPQQQDFALPHRHMARLEI